MDFYSRAWTAAAEHYGAARAERWGRWARLLRIVQVLAIVVLVLGIVVLWQGRP